jgi:nucleoside-diphosphate-sugar epimerase
VSREVVITGRGVVAPVGEGPEAFFDALTSRRSGIADGVGAPRPPAKPVPLWFARIVAWWQEGRARRRNAPEPPRLTQARLKFMGLNLDFSIEKAKRELGYQPRYRFDEGLRETVAWYKQNA